MGEINLFYIIVQNFVYLFAVKLNTGQSLSLSRPFFYGSGSSQKERFREAPAPQRCLQE